jgi:tetratricopeptide (TPR) repeat protein
MALKDGDIATAERYIASATDANGLAEIMGNLNLAKGNFAQAEENFAEVYSNSAVLAQILNHDYVSAAVTLKYIKNPDATSEYLRALMSARMNNNDDAVEALREAIKKDASFAKYADNDIELNKIQK